MNDFTGFDALNRLYKRLEKRTVVFHPVALDMNDDNSKGQLLEIVLMLKASIRGDQNVTLPLSLGNQSDIWQRTPFCFRNGQDFMTRKGLPKARIDTFV